MEYKDIIFYLLLLIFAITMSRNIIYILFGPFYSFSKARLNRKIKKFNKEDVEKLIKISVIVPAWNEEVGVINTIKSLLLSDYNNLEILLINDGSTDNTRGVINDFIKNESYKYITAGKTIKLYSKENGGKGSAINFGIKRSSGNLIVTMDADSVFEKHALLNAARYFMDKKIDAAVGNIKVGNPNSFLGLIQQLEYMVGFYFKRTHAIFNSEYIISGAFGIFRRDVFSRFGYFHEINKTEDIEFSTRLQTKGCKIAFIEDAIAFTEAPSSLISLMKQRLRWKKGRLDAFYIHRSLFFSRDKKHSKFLTHYLLPITIIYELELIIEPIVILFGIIYLFSTQNHFGLIFWIIFTGLMHGMAFIFGVNRNSKKAFLVLPIYFLLSYIIIFIEIYAMYASIKLFFQKKDIKWQTWKRKGINPKLNLITSK